MIWWFSMGSAESKFLSEAIGKELPTSDGQPYSVRRETAWFKKLREVVEDYPQGTWVKVWQGTKTIARVNRNAFRNGKMNVPRGHLFDFDVLTATHLPDIAENAGVCVVRWNGVDPEATEVDPLVPYEEEEPMWLSFDPAQFRMYVKMHAEMGTLENEVERWEQRNGVRMDWHAFTAEYGASLGATDEEIREAQEALQLQSEAEVPASADQDTVLLADTFAEMAEVGVGPLAPEGDGVATGGEEVIATDPATESDLDSLADLEDEIAATGSHVPEEVQAGDEEPEPQQQDHNPGATDGGSLPEVDQEPGAVGDQASSEVAPLEVQQAVEALPSVDEAPVVPDDPTVDPPVQPPAPAVHEEAAPAQLADDAPRPSTPEAGPAAVDDSVPEGTEEPVRVCPEAPIGSNLQHEWWSPLQGAPPVCRWCDQEQPNTAELQTPVDHGPQAVVAQPDGRSIAELIAEQKAQGEVPKADEAIPGLEDLM